MDQRIRLIQADPTNFSIDRIYSIFWNTISKTRNYSPNQNSFICPHTIQIELSQNEDRIFYQPQSCNDCPQNQFRVIYNQYKYKYMICGILYFLLEGNNNLNQYYESQEFFFFQNLYGYYNLNKYYLRSICQIFREQEFQQKLQIVNQMTQAQRPIIAGQFQLTRYCVLIISPCLGTPQFREQEENSTFYLLSFQNFLQDLQQISIQIGHENVPPPCLHNTFISQRYHHFFNLHINIYQTNPICRCLNNQMGTILYALLTGEEYIDGNQGDDDQIIDDELIRFSKNLIYENQFNSSYEQFSQYQEIIKSIVRFRSSNSIILGNAIDASFYAYQLTRNLIHIEQKNLWKYYKILFLQEMIELLENKIISQLLYSGFLCEQLFQLKGTQIQRINAYLVDSNSSILSEILSNYSQQQSGASQIEQQHQIQENNNEFPQLFVTRQVLFQQFSNVIAFDSPQNQFFRNKFEAADFNYRTIIEFEEKLKDELISV
ncbi:unnamed protein product (macronuclear) [Paramecium tetraurelia]|uniref:Uncharacterized protein n=1 Tax=Paramecium tetraurelia TaxID=5888 RepID=A0DCI8_PARTE|nr:uncharacterized protein GSPATT00015633001 [Paramecium tetraurelia]CAK80755.1 unnamed protein product [Paramecium tetraurelia]|eukprot:XP_001448152.1 hypothetical protein (macronuclear) [Paramecium tetraurelia strain d4-2]